MANQWSVLETLTPQGFLSFRDGLGTASGFESYQMREFEILLGLKNEDRLGRMDPLKGFKKVAKDSAESAQIYQQLKMVMEQKSLFESLMDWIGRTPIMGSKFGSKEDSTKCKNMLRRIWKPTGNMEKVFMEIPFPNKKSLKDWRVLIIMPENF